MALHLQYYPSIIWHWFFCFSGQKCCIHSYLDILWLLMCCCYQLLAAKKFCEMLYKELYGQQSVQGNKISACHILDRFNFIFNVVALSFGFSESYYTFIIMHAHTHAHTFSFFLSLAHTHEFQQSWFFLLQPRESLVV